MKRYRLILYIMLTLAVIPLRVFCYESNVINASGTKYFSVVKDALSGARESIHLVMFIIEVSPYREGAKVNQLVDELVKAKQRGVEVEVILDQNIDFVGRRQRGAWRVKISSMRAYKILKRAGIKVYYDVPAKYMHAKAIVIDGEIIIAGSANWTGAALDNNIEVSFLIRSEQLADEVLSYMKAINIDQGIDEYLERSSPSTPVNREFMKNAGLAPEMIKRHDERCFDVYLWLLKNFDGNPEAKLNLFYDEVAKYLGIYEGMTRTAYRRQVIKVLRKLEEKYILIKFEPRYAKEAAITLLNYDDAGKTYEHQEGLYFELPHDYFDFAWNKRLSLRAKFCYLINLAYSSVSDTRPFWSKSVKTITGDFGNIGADVIYKGMNELRRQRIIAVSYDALTGKPYEKRAPKVYKILRLYDPEELRLRLKALEEKYGKETYTPAARYAEIVFEENNPEVVEDIILRQEKYGKDVVKKAFAIVARKNIDNPKRSYNYVVGIIENIVERRDAGQ